MSAYNGGLTREQFLFYEIRILANLLCDGYTEVDAVEKIVQENLFQFPTERMIKTIANACLRRIQALDNTSLVDELAHASFEVAKQINLYAMMRQNQLVWDFMVTVIGEKFATRDYVFEKKDLNLFFLRLSEQVDGIAAWSDTTIKKIKQILTKCLVECEYLENTKSTELNPIYLCPELEAGIRANRDNVVFAAFNYFE